MATTFLEQTRGEPLTASLLGSTPPPSGTERAASKAFPAQNTYQQFISVLMGRKKTASSTARQSLPQQSVHAVATRLPSGHV